MYVKTKEQKLSYLGQRLSKYQNWKDSHYFDVETDNANLTDPKFLFVFMLHIFISMKRMASLFEHRSSYSRKLRL
jgi:hypothetical protein